MAKKQPGGMPTIDQMYVPEKEQAGGMDTIKPAGGMDTTKPAKPVKKTGEFDLYKTVKQAADKNEGMKKGGKVSSASKRADGCCVKGKTKGRMV